LNKKGQLTATASPAQPRRPEIPRLATAFYGGGGNFLRLATAYELYGGGSGVYIHLHISLLTYKPTPIPTAENVATKNL